MRGALRAESPTKPIWDLPAGPTRRDEQTLPDSAPASTFQVPESPEGVTLNERLTVLQEERHRLVVEAVGSEAAKILGEPILQSVNPDLTFAELDFDSQMTVEFESVGGSDRSAPARHGGMGSRLGYRTRSILGG